MMAWIFHTPLYHRDMLDMSLLLFAGGAAFRQSFDSNAYASYALFNVILVGEGVAQAELLLASPIDVKWFSDDESNLFVHGFAQQTAGSHITW